MKEIIQEASYLPEEVFNVDEAGVFWKNGQPHIHFEI
jgi:hypothetical protein